MGDASRPNYRRFIGRGLLTVLSVRHRRASFCRPPLGRQRSGRRHRRRLSDRHRTLRELRQRPWTPACLVARDCRQPHPRALAHRGTPAAFVRSRGRLGDATNRSVAARRGRNGCRRQTRTSDARRRSVVARRSRPPHPLRVGRGAAECDSEIPSQRVPGSYEAAFLGEGDAGGGCSQSAVESLYGPVSGWAFANLKVVEMVGSWERTALAEPSLQARLNELAECARTHGAVVRDAPDRLNKVYDDVHRGIETFLLSDERLASADDVVGARRWPRRHSNPPVGRRSEGSGTATRKVEWHGTNQLDDPLIGGLIVSGRDVSDLVEMERRISAQTEQLLHSVGIGASSPRSIRRSSACRGHSLQFACSSVPGPPASRSGSTGSDRTR